MFQEPAPSASTPSTTMAKGAPPSNDQVPGGNLLVYAYILVLIVVLLMIIRVFQRQTTVAKKLDELEADLNSHKRADRPHDKR